VGLCFFWEIRLIPWSDAQMNSCTEANRPDAIAFQLDSWFRLISHECFCSLSPHDLQGGKSVAATFWAALLIS
jgi:hypothetical protein